jgi:soluble lytic murein transglycosylase-like protein
MTLEQLHAVARAAAVNAGIDPVLVQAVCEHESRWNPWAVRYEPAFYAKYVAPLQGLTDTERIMRSTSWGLCQVMGEVAREKGFAGTYLAELLDPPINLKYGCIKLAECLTATKQDLRAALLRWNGGGNPAYPDMVIPLMEKYR